MKTSTLPAATRLFVAALAAVLALAPAAGAQQRQPDPSGRVAPMFTRLDVNGDGAITQQEFLNRPGGEGAAPSPDSHQHLETRFRQLDSDGNGTLSPSELIGSGRGPASDQR